MRVGITAEMGDSLNLTLFDLPESLELEVAGFFTVYDLISLLISTKKASEYNRPAIWRDLLSIANGLKATSRCKKHKKRGISKKQFCKNVYRDTYINTWKAVISEKRKDLIKSLLSSYDAQMKLSIHKECIRTAKATAISHCLIVNQKQATCTHNQILLVHGKTIYPTTDYCIDSRELILHTACSSCSSMCYEKTFICATCKDSNTTSTGSCCLDCFEAGEFKKHSHHPKVEFDCPRDYFLPKEYTVGCFDCGIAFVVRVASNYKLRRQKTRKCSNGSGTSLSTVDFICSCRQNVFRSNLLSHDGQAELIFRMKVGDMMLYHNNNDLSSRPENAYLEHTHTIDKKP